MEQRRLDFARAEKLNLLENLDLPEPPKGMGTTRAGMAAVLKAIDCKARDNPVFTISWDDLARITQMSKSTCRRAARALVAFDLLILHARRNYGWHANGMQIVWSNLIDHRASPPPPIDPFFADVEHVGAGGKPVHDPSGHGAIASGQDVRPSGQDVRPSGHHVRPSGHGDHSKKSTIDRPRSAKSTATSRIRPADDQPSDRRTTSRRPLARPTVMRSDEAEADCNRFEAERYARRVARTIGDRELEDIELSAKLGFLVASGQISEGALARAIEAVQIFPPRNPAAYFQTCLRNELPPGDCLNSLLASVPCGGRGGHRRAFQPR